MENQALDFSKNQKRITQVVLLSFLVMIVEIVAGYLTGSMALLADGWHMASHVGALGMGVVAYRLAASESFTSKLSFGGGKVLALGGYSSGVALAVVAIAMAVESLTRLFNPVTIQYSEAIWVAVLGLIVNIASAFLLSGPDHHHHHDHDHHDDHDHDHHHDHNFKGAYLHVIADAMTSVFAILALWLGERYQLHAADPIMGVVGGLVIMKWAWGLCRQSSRELLDAKVEATEKLVRDELEKHGAKALDLRIWKIAPGELACQLIVASAEKKGVDFFRGHLKNLVGERHLIIEERSL
jgi:cation diffusion facilitator family transporter